MLRNDEPYLFDDIIDEEPEEIIEDNFATEYMDKSKRIAFDIMEELDLLFRHNLTIERYDQAQENVIKIISKAFTE